MEEAYTVVIFSSPIEQWLIKQGPIVKHIKWLLAGLSSSKSYGTHIAKTIFNTFINQLKDEQFLRIVSIEALDENGEIPAETSRQVLTYLARNVFEAKSSDKRVIDVILLPKFNPVFLDTIEILPLLLYLRRHSVLISNSCLDASLPSTETIAVSGATEIHSTPASVTDFVVTQGESNGNDSTEKEVVSRDLVEQFALGVLAALSLGILHYLDENHATSLKGKNLYSSSLIVIYLDYLNPLYTLQTSTFHFRFIILSSGHLINILFIAQST